MQSALKYTLFYVYQGSVAFCHKTLLLPHVCEKTGCEPSTNQVCSPERCAYSCLNSLLKRLKYINKYGINYVQ